MALQAICDRLGPEQIDALLRKWLAILPHPFSGEDRAAGYRYDLSILQAEFSLTQMLDKPVSGRVFFEQVIRDNLDIGRPDQVALIFDRRLMRRGPRATPGRFRTRVITQGVTPSLHVDYKHTRIKQYHKQRRALRTETTINDTTDFGIGKRLTNLPALREIGTPPTGACCASNHSAMTRSPAPTPCTPSPRRSPPKPAPASPGCSWDSSAATPCSRRCRCSGCNPTGSPTRISARSPPNYAGSTRPRSPPDRSPTTCAGCACAASSPVSRTPTGTDSPNTACTPRCSSPPSTTDSYPPAWPNSPTSSPRHHCARHPAPTAMPSITLPAQQVWPPNTHSRSQHTKLDSKFRLRRI